MIAAGSVGGWYVPERMELTTDFADRWPRGVLELWAKSYVHMSRKMFCTGTHPFGGPRFYIRVSHGRFSRSKPTYLSGRSSEMGTFNLECNT